MAAVVRAASMGPVRELQESLRLPFYVLWDDWGMTSARYGVGESDIQVVVVETDGRVAWRSERNQLPQAEEMLREIKPAPETAHTHTETNDALATEDTTDGRAR